ncbi:MAG: response regulator [Desulfosarcina sp.]
MIRLLLVTLDKTNFGELLSGIQKQVDVIGWAGSGRQALETLAEKPADLVVVDEALGDMTGLELVHRLVAVNPVINCALVSPLAEAAYHEASEGLGILMRLPLQPGVSDGERLMTHLNQIVAVHPETRNCG